MKKVTDLFRVGAIVLDHWMYGFLNERSKEKATRHFGKKSLIYHLNKFIIKLRSVCSSKMFSLFTLNLIAEPNERPTDKLTQQPTS